MAVVGIRVCTPDGRRPALVRSILRAWLGMLGIIIWIMTGVFSLFDARRRSLLDRLMHTEVRYSVPGTSSAGTSATRSRRSVRGSRRLELHTTTLWPIRRGVRQPVGRVGGPDRT